MISRRAQLSKQAQRENWWTGALVAGVIGGLGDGIAATRHLLLAPDSVRDVVLVLVSLGGGVLVAAIAGAAIPWTVRRLGVDWPISKWSSFVCGATAWTGTCIAALLPGWWALLGLLALGLLPWIVHRDSGRPRMIVALGFLALLALRVADDHRPRDRNTPPAEPGPDIVFVVIDGLRADQIARRPKGDLPAMPNLSELAQAGTHFTRVTTPATTRTASQRAALLGVAPWSTPPKTSWARELRSQGWRSAIFAGPETSAVAAAAGFAIRDLDPGWLAGASASTPGNLWLRMATATGRSRPGHRIVAAWSGWVETLPPARPAASVLHLTDLSWPTRPSPPWDTAFQRAPAELGPEADAPGVCANSARANGLDSQAEVRASHDGAAASVDALLREIWQTASTRPRGALLIIMGSRGTPMGEDGRWLQATGGIHPAEITVPLIVVGEGAPAGSTLGVPISTPDVVATLRARLGLTTLAGARPIPGLARGYRPRSAALSVDSEGTVVAVETEGIWRRTTDGSHARFVDGQWQEGPDTPLVPIPVLSAIHGDESPCR